MIGKSSDQILQQIQNALLKVVDRSDKIVNLLLNAGVAYYGYQVNHHWTGALTGLIGMKLAQADNLVSGTAGIGILGAMGAMQLTKPFWATPVVTPERETDRRSPYL